MAESHTSRLETLFDQVVELPAPQRGSFLEEHCGSNLQLRSAVERLLDADDAVGERFLQGPGVDVKTAVVRPASKDMSGAVVGRYKLLQQIGEGGISVVYLAEQSEPVRRKVALKIVKPGMDSKQVLARFELERNVLALFNHPHVARVFDAGMTDNGRPYFVMEHVEGLPLTRFCDKQRLTTTERLELFIPVCEAVQHAHQKGIIHRDIKPGNILVALQDGKPLPKVIDFGIAKATGGELTERTLFTEQCQLIGTPEYMSPEQAEMSDLGVDTRTDIYSLGVVLYELLAGLLPFDPAELRMKSLTEIQRTIRDVEPNKPSTRLSAAEAPAQLVSQRSASDIRALQRQVCGDLDWIVMKCLEKDRARRYETANALAMDIGRHLAGEPVVAAPPTRLYRARKFVRRNRTGVLAASLVAAALVLGMIGTSVEADRANKAEDQAQQRASALEQVADFQSSQLAGLDVKKMGEGLRRDIIDRRRAALELAGLDEDEIQRGLLELERSLDGVNFTGVAGTSLEENIFERALQGIEEQFAEQPLVQAQLLQSVAKILRGFDMPDRAAEPQERALEIRRRELGDAHADTLRSLLETSALYYAQSRYDDAESCVRRAVETARRELGAEHLLTLQAINALGVLLHGLGEYAESAQCFGEVMDVGRRVLGEEDRVVMSAMGNLAMAFASLGKEAEAEARYREALELRRRILGNEHGSTLWAVQFLGTCLHRQGKLEEAERFLREALEGNRSTRGDEHSRTHWAMYYLAELLRARGNFEEAERIGAEAVGKVHHAGAELLLIGHAQTLMAMERFEQAEAELHDAQAILEDSGAFISIPDKLKELTRELSEAFTELYDAWHTADPEGGFITKAAEWRAKLPDPEPNSASL